MCSYILRNDLTPMSHISVLFLRPLRAYWQIAQQCISMQPSDEVGIHRLLLSKLDENARVYAFDKDPQALEVAAKLWRKKTRDLPLFMPVLLILKKMQEIGVMSVDGIWLT